MARKQNMLLWRVLWRFPLALQLGNFMAKLHPLCSCQFSLNRRVSVVLCTYMLHQVTVTLREEHVSLWDKLQKRCRIISPWTIWLVSYLEADSLFRIRWPTPKVTQTSILRRAGVERPGARDINSKSNRRKDTERKPRTTFHLEFHISTAEHSLCANINHRCTKLLTMCFSSISLFSPASCRLFHFECVAG